MYYYKLIKIKVVQTKILNDKNIYSFFWEQNKKFCFKMVIKNNIFIKT